MKVVIIGAGSLEFAARLTADMLTFPALRNLELALVDIDPERLHYAGKITANVVQRGGYGGLRYSMHTDRRDALRGADVVIVSILVGGYDAIESEIDIPIRYGIDQAIGDTLTPGGVMRCLRTLPELVRLARDVESLCPDAWVLNYTNPMAMLCWGMRQAVPSLKLVGLCHSVQHTTQQWARWLKLPWEEVRYDCAGINHQAWITTFEHRGEDQLPKIRDLALVPKLWNLDSSRLEYVKHLGYPVTEMSGHNSEYSPWFRKRPELVARYCPGGGWNGGSGFIKELYNRPDWRQRMERMANGENPVALERSHEYGAAIVNALAGGGDTVIWGNVDNQSGTEKGLRVHNLPADACVEVACDIGERGIAPRHYGALPSHLAAINTSQINVQRLAVEATLNKDPEAVFHAMALDPLTGAVCTLDEIRAMTRELMQAQERWIPEFGGRLPRDCPVMASNGRV